MKTRITLLFAALVLCLGAYAQNHSIYALQGGGANLVKFSSADPSATTTVPISGVALLGPLVSIDFRPATGELYGMGYNTTTSEVQLYTIDTVSGLAMEVGTPLTLNLSIGGNTAFDFNPVVDRIRVISTLDSNYRINPNDGLLVSTDLNISYNGSDPNAGADPNVMGVAYTNSYDSATATTLYAYDLTADVLTTIAPPNNGTLTTVGPSGLDFTVVDMDISSDNAAYIVGHTSGGGGDSLYTLNLSTGAVTGVRHIGSGLAIQDIAVWISGHPPVGITDAPMAMDVTIYPNPATDKINVELGSSEVESTIRITDVAGKELMNYQVAGGSGTTSVIDISSYAPGIYYVSVESNGSRTVKAVGKY